MNREIKFRAWHKNNHHMCQNVKTDLLDKDYLEFMQYTELHDKNGKEIYESDIVTDGVLNYLVVFYAGSWCLKFWTESSAWHSLYPVARQRKIIGNIYENPELVK